MTTTTTASATVESPVVHYIEDAARVWLRLNDTGDGWTLDSWAPDESFLSDYRDYDESGPNNEQCECPDPDACETERGRVEREVGMPTPTELLHILATGLGYNVEKLPA